MRYLLSIIALLTLPFVLSGQTLKGKLYNASKTVKDIKILNKSQNRFTVSDENGDFSIIAAVNDTITFQSLFYHPKEIVLKSTDFEDTAVFELQEIVSELDAVEVINDIENKFNAIAFNKSIEAEKKNLAKKPLIQSGDNLMPTLDLKKLSKTISKLFKRKDSPELIYKPITYKQIDSLFAKSSFFNKTLITETLKIPKAKIKFFYDFCDAKQISSELLHENKKMELLDKLVLNSQLFLILLEEYDEKNVKKD